jgi:hypothetical protein
MAASLSAVLQPAGLFVGFLAAVFLAISQYASETAADGASDRSGRSVENSLVALRYPRLWSSGIVLLFVGFALQLAGYIAERMR